MPVFKGAMKIARQNMGLILMYVGIMAAILTLTIQDGGVAKDSAFSVASVKITYIDEDNSPLSQALIAHLDKIHELMPSENDPEFLMEELYYRNTQYVLRIPAGFGEDSAANPLQITEVPGSYTGFYLSSQIESYLRQIALYEVGGFSQEDAAALAESAPVPSVEVAQKSQSQSDSLRAFFQFLPYGAMCMLCFMIGNVLCSFMKTEVRKRTVSSAVTHRRTEVELLLAVAVFGLLIFGVFLLMGTAFFGFSFWNAQHLPLYLANMTAMILVSMSIAYLISMVSTGPDTLTGIINSASLGMSFLCGVFVPLELLGEGVKAAAHFLPYYWYEQNLLTLSQFTDLSSQQNSQIWQFLIIQLFFAAAFAAIGSAVHKKKI